MKLEKFPIPRKEMAAFLSIFDNEFSHGLSVLRPQGQKKKSGFEKMSVMREKIAQGRKIAGNYVVLGCLAPKKLHSPRNLCIT